MRNTVTCPPRTDCAAKRPRRASLRTRALVAAAAALLLATMVYGETWLLGDPAPCVECAVTRNVARVLDGDAAAAPAGGAAGEAAQPRTVSAGT